MENASKALLLAGGVLIGLIVMSIGVYVFSIYSNNSENFDKNREAAEIKNFNANFTKFEGREDITIQEIVTLTKFAKQYEQENNIHIVINLAPLGDINKPDNSEEYFIDLIKNNSTINDETIKIKCYKFVQMEYDNGKVKTITFSEN